MRCCNVHYHLYEEVVHYSLLIVFLFKQKTAYDMRISDWSSDVCSSDLLGPDVRWQGVSDLGVDRGCKRPVSCERRAGPFDPRHDGLDREAAPLRADRSAR